MIESHDLYMKPKYEYAVRATSLESIIKIKTKAFQAMNTLEGWCSQNKASILMDIIFMMKPRKIVSLGVFGGKTLIPMAFALKENNVGKIYGIDPWDNDDILNWKTGEEYEWWQQIDQQTIRSNLIKKTHELGLLQQVSLIKGSYKNAKPIFNIDILYLTNEFSTDTTITNLNKWAPLVRKGGVIILYDLLNEDNTLIEWLNEQEIPLTLFKGEENWGIWVKK